MGHFHTVQICLNGHCITSIADYETDHMQKFCDKCGAKTITACPSCNTAIKGNYDDGGLLTCLYSSYKVPSYCHNCGSPYPWVTSALEAIKEIISEEEAISEIEKEKLVSSLPDIISETPKTQLAATRVKKALLSVGKFTADGLRQFVIDFACELAKRFISIS